MRGRSRSASGAFAAGASGARAGSFLIGEQVGHAHETIEPAAKNCTKPLA